MKSMKKKKIMNRRSVDGWIQPGSKPTTAIHKIQRKNYSKCSTSTYINENFGKAFIYGQHTK